MASLTRYVKDRKYATALLRQSISGTAAAATSRDVPPPRPPHRRSRAPKIAILLGLGAGTAVGSWYLDQRTRRLVHEALTSCWDCDWDKDWRPEVPPEPADEASDEENDRITSTSVKGVVLVRHGQYFHDGEGDSNQGLTDLGKEQAHLAGQRLAQTMRGLKIRAIYHSDMKRAKETASIIAKSFPGIPLVEDETLAEGCPAFPVPPHPTYKPTLTAVEVDGQRIEAAFRKYFFRPPAPKREEKYPREFEVHDIVVCHGNVIRYFFCRALQFPQNAWLRLAVYNCGITQMRVHQNGDVSCRGLGDVGFLPPEKVTYS